LDKYDLEPILKTLWLQPATGGSLDFGPTSSY
jgi:hypothetical protein